MYLIAVHRQYLRTSSHFSKVLFASFCPCYKLRSTSDVFFFVPFVAIIVQKDEDTFCWGKFLHALDCFEGCCSLGNIVCTGEHPLTRHRNSQELMVSSKPFKGPAIHSSEGYNNNDPTTSTSLLIDIRWIYHLTVPSPPKKLTKFPQIIFFFRGAAVSFQGSHFFWLTCIWWRPSVSTFSIGRASSFSAMLLDFRRPLPCVIDVFGYPVTSGERIGPCVRGKLRIWKVHVHFDGYQPLLGRSGDHAL